MKNKFYNDQIRELIIWIIKTLTHSKFLKIANFMKIQLKIVLILSLERIF